MAHPQQEFPLVSPGLHVPPYNADHHYKVTDILVTTDGGFIQVRWVYHGYFLFNDAHKTISLFAIAITD